MMLYVDAILEPDEKWHRFRKVWTACEEAKITPPEEVLNYFGGMEPDPWVRVVSLSFPSDGVEHAVTQWVDTRGINGCSIDPSKLPKGTKELRVYGR